MRRGEMSPRLQERRAGRLDEAEDTQQEWPMSPDRSSPRWCSERKGGRQVGRMRPRTALARALYPQVCLERGRWAGGISTLGWVGRRWEGLTAPGGELPGPHLKLFVQKPQVHPPIPPHLTQGMGLGSLIKVPLLQNRRIV